MIYINSYFDIIKNKNKIQKNLPLFIINPAQKQIQNENEDIIIRLNTNNSDNNLFNILKFYNERKKLDLSDNEIKELLSNLIIGININSWINCKGVFYIKSNIKKRPVKMWYKLSSKSNVYSNPQQYKINQILPKKCKEINNKEQIYFNKNKELSYLTLYNYLKNELIENFKDLIHIIDN